VADPQFTRRRQLDNVTTIDIHHPTEFRHDYIQEAVKIDRIGQSEGKAVDDTLPGLVHLDFAF
jgi:hypothetical protein